MDFFFLLLLSAFRYYKGLIWIVFPVCFRHLNGSHHGPGINLTISTISALRSERNTVFIEPYGLLRRLCRWACLSPRITHHHATGHWISLQDQKAHLTSQSVRVCVYLHVFFSGDFLLERLRNSAYAECSMFVRQRRQKNPQTRHCDRERGNTLRPETAPWLDLSSPPAALLSSSSSLLLSPSSYGCFLDPLLLILILSFPLFLSLCSSYRSFFFWSSFIFFSHPLPLGLAVTLG